MGASGAREVPVGTAIATLQAEFARRRLTAELSTRGYGAAAVTHCELRDEDGAVVAQAAGRGGEDHSRAGALFEAWEHYCHIRGFRDLQRDPLHMMLMSPAEILAQPALAPDAMMRRLAADFPASRIGCFRYDPLFGASQPLWYPGFARFPWYPSCPIPGDDGSYAPYLRYATNFGTAAGVSGSEAALHALMEAVEGDAFSLALLDWYAGGSAAPRLVHPGDLPEGLRQYCAEAAAAIGCQPLLFDVTTDLAVPAFCALPSQPGWLGAGGAGAAVSPAHAAERALSELVQAHVSIAGDPGRDGDMRRRLASLTGFPVLQRCAMLDPADLVSRSEQAPWRPPDWWEPPATDVAAQLAAVTRGLAGAGLRGYQLRWNPGAAAPPVLTVLVPGLETFFLSQAGIPVLPTGRAASRLSSPAPGC